MLIFNVIIYSINGMKGFIKRFVIGRTGFQLRPCEFLSLNSFFIKQIAAMESIHSSVKFPFHDNPYRNNKDDAEDDKHCSDLK
jgi:hypothetical protein